MTDNVRSLDELVARSVDQEERLNSLERLIAGRHDRSGPRAPASADFGDLATKKVARPAPTSTELLKLSEAAILGPGVVAKFGTVTNRKVAGRAPSRRELLKLSGAAVLGAGVAAGSTLLTPVTGLAFSSGQLVLDAQPARIFDSGTPIPVNTFVTLLFYEPTSAVGLVAVMAGVNWTGKAFFIEASANAVFDGTWATMSFTEATHGTVTNVSTLMMTTLNHQGSDGSFTIGVFGTGVRVIIDRVGLIH